MDDDHRHLDHVRPLVRPHSVLKPVCLVAGIDIRQVTPPANMVSILVFAGIITCPYG